MHASDKMVLRAQNDYKIHDAADQLHAIPGLRCYCRGIGHHAAQPDIRRLKYLSRLIHIRTHTLQFVLTTAHAAASINMIRNKADIPFAGARREKKKKTGATKIFVFISRSLN